MSEPLDIDALNALCQEHPYVYSAERNADGDPLILCNGLSTAYLRMCGSDQDFWDELQGLIIRANAVAPLLTERDALLARLAAADALAEAAWPVSRAGDFGGPMEDAYVGAVALARLATALAAYEAAKPVVPS